MDARILIAAGTLAALAGCGDNQEPDQADELWTRIHAEGYRDWSRAPGYEMRRQSSAPHGNMVDIYVDPTISKALEAGDPLAAWPVGSMIVKDGFDDGELSLVAVMEKRSPGWFFAEYDAEGSANYSGKPDLCVDCHASGADYVRAFPLPK